MKYHVQVDGWYLCDKARANVLTDDPKKALRLDIRQALAAVGRLVLVAGLPGKVTIEKAS